MSSVPIRVGDCKITSTNSIYNLGAYFDSLLNMEEFIFKNYRAYQFKTDTLRTICKYLSADTCACLIQGLFLSRLDDANCLLLGINETS